MRGVGSCRDTADEELTAQKYNHMVLDGKLHAAVPFAMARRTPVASGRLHQDRTTSDGGAPIAIPRHKDPQPWGP
jgi:hypothetical protein